ncbi:hypothetical protein LTR66_001946 [Elasticomyces elasticus]|nr:hypothetical protein LTR66_001946 [Elasticomyces elasticus]
MRTDIPCDCADDEGPPYALRSGTGSFGFRTASLNVTLAKPTVPSILSTTSGDSTFSTNSSLADPTGRSASLTSSGLPPSWQHPHVVHQRIDLDHSPAKFHFDTHNDLNHLRDFFNHGHVLCAVGNRLFCASGVADHIYAYLDNPHKHHRFPCRSDHLQHAICHDLDARENLDHLRHITAYGHVLRTVRRELPRASGVADHIRRYVNDPNKHHSVPSYAIYHCETVHVRTGDYIYRIHYQRQDDNSLCSVSH